MNESILDIISVLGGSDNHLRCEYCAALKHCAYS
jgi:hypothetical protein